MTSRGKKGRNFSDLILCQTSVITFERVIYLNQYPFSTRCLLNINGNWGVPSQKKSYRFVLTWWFIFILVARFLCVFFSGVKCEKGIETPENEWNSTTVIEFEVEREKQKMGKTRWKFDFRYTFVPHFEMKKKGAVLRARLMIAFTCVVGFAWCHLRGSKVITLQICFEWLSLRWSQWCYSKNELFTHYHTTFYEHRPWNLYKDTRFFDSISIQFYHGIESNCMQLATCQYAWMNQNSNNEFFYINNLFTLLRWAIKCMLIANVASPELHRNIVWIVYYHSISHSRIQQKWLNSMFCEIFKCNTRYSFECNELYSYI